MQCFSKWIRDFSAMNYSHVLERTLNRRLFLVDFTLLLSGKNILCFESGALQTVFYTFCFSSEKSKLKVNTPFKIVGRAKSYFSLRVWLSNSGQGPFSLTHFESNLVVASSSGESLPNGTPMMLCHSALQVATVESKVVLQSGPETAPLVANPTWASKIWPCVHAKSDRFLSILD